MKFDMMIRIQCKYFEYAQMGAVCCLSDTQSVAHKCINDFAW